ncbi:coiled-coil domain-containing protein 43-like [Centruroides sculpturatus]|uniref:coiled-coil domain-containing protein 43-like n=1 Tax=Centruroides sculpturatus TaxID=218467 RepID=UPI000C6D1FEE|nr:coiled-coil domain-containing protein 43-like [Centruroides sculpturatus]
MAAPAENFEDWLNEKLKKLNTDQDVFGSYIKSILDGGESEEEKREALEEILGEVTNGDDIASICDEIFLNWASKCELSSELINTESNKSNVDVDAKIASIMEAQAKSVVTERKITNEDKELREAILAHYSQVCETDEVDGDDDATNRGSKEAGTSARSASTITSDPFIVKNTNVDDVIQAERIKREKSKAENEKKKAQDKLNREKQKQQQQQRKEKEKKRTQKLERKR